MADGGDPFDLARTFVHTARVHQPGLALFITPGDGTEHRPLA